MRAILMYHSLDDSGSPISLAPAVFAEQVRWLAGGRVRVVGLDQLAAVPATEDAVAITFDDGFANFAEHAAPRLRDHNLPVTLFVVSDHNGTNRWGGVPAPGIPVLPLLDWPAVGRLAEAGVTLGGHTRRHPRLAGQGPELLEDEIGGCVERIEQETGRRPASFAYPYGALDDRVEAVAARHFRLACTTELRVLEPGDTAHRLPRLDMYYFRESGALEQWGTARFRWTLAFRAGARRIREAVRPAGRERA